MSRIDELIEELCPGGVESKALGAVARLVRGNGMPKTMLTAEGVGAIHYGQIYTRYATWAVSTHSFVSAEDALRLAKVDHGDIIITNTSENIADVGKAVAWLGRSQIVTGGHATVIKHTLDPKYLAYWFQSPSFADQKRRLASGTKVIDVSARQLEGVRLPVPPIEVQREIVRILDTFAELEAELEARRRQYEHYRATALTFASDSGVHWSTLGDTSVRVTSGGTPPSGTARFYGGAIPWLRTQDVNFTEIHSTSATITEDGLRNSSAKWIPANCVVVAMYGATAAKVAINAIPLTTNQACCNLQIDPEKAEHRYVFHWIASQYERLKALGEGSQSNLNSHKVREFPIALPPLAEQRRIIEVLDKFDALVSDLTVGLPAELAARRKQYEHYRDRLLTFEEASA